MPDTESKSPTAVELDLRGVRCPLNWAKAKVRLEQMSSGATLRLVVDDPRAARDIPRAAEASGYHAADVVQVAAGCWQIDLVR